MIYFVVTKLLQFKYFVILAGNTYLGTFFGAVEPLIHVPWKPANAAPNVSLEN